MFIKTLASDDFHLEGRSFGRRTKQYPELKKMNPLLPFETWPKQWRDAVRCLQSKANLYWKYLTHLYRWALMPGGPILRSQTILKPGGEIIRPSMVHVVG